MAETDLPTVPWYESNLFWGPIALGVAIVLTAVASMKHDLRWLLWVAWPLFVFPCWSLIKLIQSTLFRRALISICILLTGFILYRINVWLQPLQEHTITALRSQAAPSIVPKENVPVVPHVTPYKPQEKTPTPKPSPPKNNNGSVEGNITQGPCSNLQIGGSNNSATGGNCAPIDRRLSSDQSNFLIACFRTTPGKFTVAAIANNGEAYRYAQDWYEVFNASGWTNEQPIPVATIMIGGEMWSGLRLSVPGTFDDISKTAPIADRSPEKNALECLNRSHIVGGAVPYKDMPTGTIRLAVSDRPSEK